MIVLDEVTAAATILARDRYMLLADESDCATLRSLIGAGGIMTPTGHADADDVRDLYQGVAERADLMAAEAPSTGDELALRRAAAHLRQAARLLAGSARTQRIPRITDEEAAARIRAGHHRDELVDTNASLERQYAAAVVIHADTGAVVKDRGTVFDPRRRQEIPAIDVELAIAIAAPTDRLAVIRERHVALQPVDDEEPIMTVEIDLGGES